MLSADFYIFQHRITTENWIINLVNKNFQQSQQIKQFIKYYLAPRSQVRTKRSLFDSTVRPEIQLKARPGPHPPTNRRPCPRRWKCRLPRWHHVWKFRLSVRHRARIQEKRGSGGRGVPHVALIAVVVGVISFRDLYIVFVPRKTFARGDFPRTWGRRSVCFFFFFVVVAVNFRQVSLLVVFPSLFWTSRPGSTKVSCLTSISCPSLNLSNYFQSLYFLSIKFTLEKGFYFCN